MRALLTYAVVSMLALPTAAHARQATCAPAPAGADPTMILDRAAAAMGLDRVAAEGLVLRYHYMQTDAQPHQSDRSYPPFFDAMRSGTRWFDAAAVLERAEDRSVFPRNGPSERPRTMLQGARFAAFVRDSGAQVLPPPAVQFFRGDWLLNPWAVVSEWRTPAGPPLRIHGLCSYREEQRMVLARTVGEREERLFLDRESGLPVKLDYVAPHYLWGQTRVEFLYTLWVRAGEGALYPAAAHVLEDAQTRSSRTVGAMELQPITDVPFIGPAPPEALGRPDPGTANGLIVSQPVDTVRVGRDAYLLVNPTYTEAVALREDTIFLLDATLGESRARQDSTLIAALFPGDHPVVVVVSDLAWPHIAGVRTWVAMGATIASHPSFEPFLREVVERPWTLEPDLLERRRAERPFRFRPTRDGASFAGGAVRVHTIDGIGSEGALMTWLPDEAFLWAGDYVQSVDAPSQYAAEVRAAVLRAGLTPVQVAAQHLALTPWAAVEAALAAGGATAFSGPGR